MAQQSMDYLRLTRAELKERFKAGRMPTEEDFMSLIDSMVNAMDEGFVVSEENGLEIKQKKDNGKLASFFANLAEHRPQWFLNTRKNAEKKETVVNLKTAAMRANESAVSVVSEIPDESSEEPVQVRVGIGSASPRSELDVNGLVSCKGRIGYEDKNYDVWADGKWYDVTDVLTGCQCFEIVAGVGGVDGDGRFALAHAIATNVFNRRPRVRMTQSFSGWRGAKIDIRWHRCENKYEYTLQIRTRHQYDKKKLVKVSYRLTKLWYDTQMVESIVK